MVIDCVAVFVQPAAFVAVTIYDVPVVTLAVTVAPVVAVKPADGVHVKVDPAEVAVSVTPLLVAHTTAEGLAPIVTVGAVLIVTLVAVVVYEVGPAAQVTTHLNHVDTDNVTVEYDDAVPPEGTL